MLRAIRAIDNRVLDFTARLQCRFMDILMVMATYAGTGAFVWWVVLTLPFVLSDAYRRTGMTMIVALGINYLIGEVLIKKVVRRARPSAILPPDEMKIPKPKDHSFPSGHTASSFCAFAVTLLCCPSAIWIPSLIGAVIISFSRLYLRVHYLSDVLVGMALGLVDGTAIAMLFLYVIPYKYGAPL